MAYLRSFSKVFVDLGRFIWEGSFGKVHLGRFIWEGSFGKSSRYLERLLCTARSLVGLLVVEANYAQIDFRSPLGWLSLDSKGGIGGEARLPEEVGL